MKMVPVIKTSDLTRDGADLQLSRHAGDGVFGSLNRIYVEDMDEHYATFRARGLDTTRRPESPIHTTLSIKPGACANLPSPTPDGNGLCFCAPIC